MLQQHKCSHRGTTRAIEMFAIVEQWEAGVSCHTDIADKYVLLMLFKLGLDMTTFCLCSRKSFPSILSMCSLSIVLADLATVSTLATVWFLGPEETPVPLCSLLAIASTTYEALPMPMAFLGFLNYCLCDTCQHKRGTSWKKLRDALLTLLVWITALIYSFCFTKAEMVELDVKPKTKGLVCQVKESTAVTCFIFISFTVVLCAALPYLSSIPQWLEEADQLSEKREDKDNQTSDFLVVSSKHTETKLSVEYLEKIDRPPMWLSLMLGFAVFWMPYLSTSAICLFFGFGVPAYINVSVPWLECTNSLLMGVVFWANSDLHGPYCNLPENVCSWHVYWHLSKGTGQQQLPIAVFNLSKAKRKTLFYV